MVLRLPTVSTLVSERRTLLLLRVNALPPLEKEMPSIAVPEDKSLLRVVPLEPAEPKTSASPAWGGALPPVQLPGVLQLASVLPSQVSVAGAAGARHAAPRRAD